ncbi:MAG TPA: serine/threonine-protein kinase [Candidatus Acidoferrum sp.]|nr:serine/threonine-protein kinase [Candidatus Acidoferrum sp.]
MESDAMDLEARPTPQPGRFGRFYLQELINSGGMADIWVATDPQGRPFALRRLHDDLRFNFLARRRFARGCKILSQIHEHDLVIGYIEHGKIEGTPYLLMEYVEGSNLKQLLGRNDPALADNVAQIIIDMAAALEHVHDSGFIHLDYKPENILVTRNGSVRLVDFDLAQPKPERPKKMSRNPGTPAYMAPEQLQREGLDQRTDIFAFGVSAYEVLTLSKPFPGDTPEEILRKQLNDELIPPRELNPDVPPALEKVILKCLARDPAERYPFMSVVVRHLEQALYL